MTRLLMILAASALLFAATPPDPVTADATAPAVELDEGPPATADVDELDQVDAREQLALARVCASEVGIVSTPECAAIHEVLEDRSRQMGLSYIATVCAYSSRTCDRGRTDARRWIAWLHPSGARPDGWPATASWARHRGRWLELHRHAGEALRGRVASPCEEPPAHWGGPMDDWRAHRAGWVRVDCGPDVRNHFWAVPSRRAPS